jgi:hypothetical protein
VQDAARAESRHALEYGGAREAAGAEPLEEGGGQRAAAPAIRLADEDSSENLFAVQNAHGGASDQWPTASRASPSPAAPAIRQTSSIAATFTNADRKAPSSRNRSVS